MKAVLLLEDGTIFEGTSFGAKGQQCGEVVFNTSMTGYQEIMTDPSYHEQIITVTYPLIGNVGTNKADTESRKVFARGFIVKENCGYPSNFRSRESLKNYLKSNNMIGLEGIDTRALVKHIRSEGAMRGIISSPAPSEGPRLAGTQVEGTELSLKKLRRKLQEYPGLIGRDIVKDVTVRKSYHWDKGVIDILNNQQIKPPAKYKVVAFDFGAKYNILRLLRSHGCDIYVVPAQTSSRDVLARKPDGVFLSNGPGDPAPVGYAIETIRQLLGKVPIFGICLGHQLLALALGAKTYKLKFGHHGANHPVKNLKTKQIEITCQNHGFCVHIDSLKTEDRRQRTEDRAATVRERATGHGFRVELTHINLNDNTVEGIRCEELKAYSVQYHPEASPGPHDSNYLFETFINLMDKNRAKK